MGRMWCKGWSRARLSNTAPVQCTFQAQSMPTTPPTVSEVVRIIIITRLEWGYKGAAGGVGLGKEAAGLPIHAWHTSAGQRDRTHVRGNSFASQRCKGRSVRMREDELRCNITVSARRLMSKQIDSEIPTAAGPVVVINTPDVQITWCVFSCQLISLPLCAFWAIPSFDSNE